MSFGCTHAVDEKRCGRILHQPSNRVFRDIGVRYDIIGEVDLPASFGQPFRRNSANHFRIRYSRDHLSAVVIETQIDTGALGIHPIGEVKVNTLLLAVVLQQTAKQISAEDGQQLGLGAKQR